MSRVEAPDNTCQMNCTLLAAKLNFSTNPSSFHTYSNLVADFLDGSGLETPTRNVEFENTRTFILINFAAGSPSNVILDHRNVFQSCNISNVACIFPFDQFLHLLLRGLCHIFRPWRAFIHCHPSEVFVVFLYVVRGILEVGKQLTKSCTNTAQHLTEKFALLLALRLAILCKIIELSDALTFLQQ